MILKKIGPKGIICPHPGALYILKDLSLAFFSFIIIFKIKCLKTLNTLLICQVMFKFMFRDEFVCFSHVHEFLRYV